MQDEDFLTAAQVADALRVSTVTVQKLCRAGGLLAYHVGQQYRVSRAAFEAYRAG